MGLQVPDEPLGDIPFQKQRVGRPPRVGEEKRRSGYEYHCNVRCPFCGSHFSTKPGIMYHLKNRVCVSYDDVTSRDKAEEQLQTNFGYGSGHPDPSSVLSITGGTVRGGVHGQRWGRGRVVGTRGRGQGGRSSSRAGGEERENDLDDNPTRRLMVASAVPRGFWQPEGEDNHGVNGALNVPHMCCYSVDFLCSCVEANADASASSASSLPTVTDPHMLPCHSQTSLPSDVNEFGVGSQESYAAHTITKLASPVAAMDAFTMKGEQDNVSEIFCALSLEPKESKTGDNTSIEDCPIQIWQTTVVHYPEDTSSNERKTFSRRASGEGLQISCAKCTLMLKHVCGSVTGLHWNPFCIPSSYEDLTDQPDDSECPPRLGLLAACMENGDVNIYAIPSPMILAQKLSESLPLHITLPPVCTASLNSSLQSVVRWSPHHHGLFVTGSEDGCVTVWSLGTDLEESNSYLWPLKSRTGLATDQPRNAIPVYRFDAIAAKEDSTYMSCVVSLAWSWQSTQEIIAGYGDGSVRVWDLSSEYCIREQLIGLHSITCIASYFTGCIVGRQEGTVNFIEFPNGSSRSIASASENTISDLDVLPTMMISITGEKKKVKKTPQPCGLVAISSHDGSISVKPVLLNKRRAADRFKKADIAIRNVQPSLTEKFGSNIKLPFRPQESLAEKVRLVPLMCSSPGPESTRCGEQLCARHACLISTLGDGTVGFSLIEIPNYRFLDQSSS